MSKSPEQVARSWAAVTIKKWRANIRIQKIGSKQELISSFEAMVQAEAGGNALRIKMLYRLYGMFVDMGVGKGQKLGSQADNRYAKKLMGKSGRSRRAKKWYAKTMAAEAFILGQIMQDKFASDASARVVEQLPTNISM